MPFQTSEQITEFWQTVLRRYQRGYKHFHTDFLWLGSLLDGFPERDDMVRLITETMFNDEYFMRPIITKSASGGELETIDPGDFVINYSNVAFFYQESNRNKWDYRNFSVDYFMRSVRHCEETNRLNTPRSKRKLPEMYTYLLNLDDSKLTKFRAELKHQLIAAAQDQNASGLLQEAYASARVK